MIDPKDIPTAKLLYADTATYRSLVSRKRQNIICPFLDSERPEDLRQLKLYNIDTCFGTPRFSL